MQEKPQSEFYRDRYMRGRGYSYWCKPCKNTQKAAHNAANPGKRAEYMKRWHAHNPTYSSEYSKKHADRIRDQRFRQKYGITLAVYRAILAGQDGACAICRKPESEVEDRLLAVDHCHEGGEVRGLLCGRCNMAIGRFEHDVNLLRAAISYLERTG
jgi:Recombination endonuclease VII